MCKPNYHANLTKEQEDKLRSNMEDIREYMKSFIPEMKKVGLTYIDIDFNDGESLHNRCHISVDDYGSVNGSIGGLYVYFDSNDKGYKCNTAAWDYKQYAVSLINEWNKVKRQMSDKIEAQQAMLYAIEDFEI